MKVGLYFGSFNPVHTGHLIIASHVLDHCGLHALWFVVSPHNPLKESASLLKESHRLHLIRLAIEDEPRFRASDVEFRLPRPSYTIDTMAHLEEKYPDHEFHLIMGSDSFSNIQKWKNYAVLLERYPVIIYTRPGFAPDLSLSNKLTVVKAPLLDISSTYIREQIRNKHNIRYLVPEVVREDILANGYYQK